MCGRGMVSVWEGDGEFVGEGGEGGGAGGESVGGKGVGGEGKGDTI